MFSEVIVEKIPVEEGTLIICRRYMALQTPDGALHPADLDEYGIYQPVLELIRLLSYNADLSGEITEETREVLQQAFLGQHSQLSHILYCNREDAKRNETFLKVLNPKTEDDYVRVYSLISGEFDEKDVNCPFTCREELREYLCQYMNEEEAYKLSEAVRKGRFYTGEPVCEQERDLNKFKDHLVLLPEDIVNVFSGIKYLPKKEPLQRRIHYAILAANSLIKNDNEVWLKLH
ncbi:MAG: hypothetical protein J6J03_04575 [Tyzzerella sp.]|nr:hypothetical protein [Tyzzerella sp.]